MPWIWAHASQRPSAASRLWCAKSTPTVACSPWKTAAEETRNVHRAQCGPEGEDAHHRASSAAGLHAAEPEAQRENAQRVPKLRDCAGGPAPRRNLWLPRSAFTTQTYAVTNLTPDAIPELCEQQKSLSDAGRRQLQRGRSPRPEGAGCRKRPRAPGRRSPDERSEHRRGSAFAATFRV